MKTAKDLVRDYGLAESNVRETNLNKFMSHIGKLMLYNHILAVDLPYLNLRYSIQSRGNTLFESLGLT